MIIAMTRQERMVESVETPVERLREIASRCLNGQPLNYRHSRWLGDALEAYLGKDSASLEEALGLRYGRGGVPWWREAALRERDAALRELAAQWFAELSPCCRSRRIAELASRYAESGWLIDRKYRDMPARYAGTPKQYLWRAFKSGAAMPLGERQIRNITAGI